MSDQENSLENAPIPCHGEPRPVSAFLAPRESGFDLLLQQVGRTLERHNFAVSITASLKDAADHVMTRLLPELQREHSIKRVAFGGSMTVREAGLLEALKARPELEVMDTFDMSIGLPAMLELRREALHADLFLCSANALTRKGELVFVDGFGNRTAAVQYGPRHVILLVGRNKICTDLEAAYDRIRNFAAPVNGIRLKKNTPCVKTGRCMDCNSAERMCAAWAILERCFPAKRTHVVLIDEDAGF